LHHPSQVQSCIWRRCDNHTSSLLTYLFIFTSSCIISSEVLLIFVFDWKRHYVVIISLNSSDRYTLYILSSLLTTSSAPSVLGFTMVAFPEFALAKYKLLPAFSSPSGFVKLASKIWPATWGSPSVST